MTNATQNLSTGAAVRVACNQRLFSNLLVDLARDNGPVFVIAGRHNRGGAETWLLRHTTHAVNRDPAADTFILTYGRDPRPDVTGTGRGASFSGGIDFAREGGQVTASGWARCGTEMRQLTDLQLIGPGMHRITLSSSSDDSIPPAPPTHDGWRLRWARTLRGIDEGAWFRLVGLHVGVVGCGRTGSAVASLLARLGVHQITLVDPDRVELHNLGEMDVEDGAVGVPKAEAVARRIAGTLSSLRLVLTRAVTPVGDRRGLDAIGNCDVLFSCVDDDAARLAAATAAARRLQVLVDVGTGVSLGGADVGGDVRLLIPGDRCIVCFGGLARLAQATERAIYHGGSASPLPSFRALGTGSLNTVNQIAAATAVQLLVDLVAERLERSTWVHLHWERGGFRSGTVDVGERADPVYCLCQVAGSGDGSSPAPEG